MLGAIIGDIVGSVYEWNNIKTKDFPLFRKDCFFTDDTVMTCAVAEAIMNGGQKDDFIDAMKKYGRMYPNADYGARFNAWLNSDNREPYNSFGNGSAMCISPCAWIMDCGFYAKTGMWPSSRGLTSLSAEVTHNHPEGVKGAMATADAIFLCRFYFGGYCREYEQSINDNPTECKRRIKDYIEKEYDYNLSQTLDEIRPNYRFNETCQETVPQAIIAFLESRDFEDAIRNAISLGGDSDTLNEVISGIDERDYIPKLGIIPGGTGNLITKLLEINQDIDGAIDELDFDLTNKIDIGKANDNYFGYIFSIGSLPEAIHNVEIEDKTKFGILTYAVNTMKSVMTDQVFNIKVETENGNYVGEASHVLVLLTNYFADKKIFEENKDGYANILILKDASIFSKLSVIPDLLKGDVIANDNIEYIKARNIKISSDSELESDVDGDKSDNLPVEIKVLAQRVEVFSKPKED
ncbi:hydrolase [Streptococcus pneumoniae]|nr:ADP-ribosylglycohydrolase family protein [Streptococcus pneumoniae]VIX19887.1 hydrolase [Streptococcus pneumoniae]